MLQRILWRYQQVEDTPELANSEHTIGKINYGKIGLLFTIAALTWGILAWQLKNQIVLILPVKFKALGASDATIALIVSSSPYILNMILNPIVSFKSDRTRSRFGRRMPFILFSVISSVIAYITLGWAPEIGTHIAGMFNLDAGKVIMNLMIAFTVISVICNIFIGCTIYYLFADIIPKHYFGRFMIIFQMVCSLAGIIGSRFILPLSDKYFGWTYTGVSLFYLFAYAVFFMLIREGEYPPVDDAEACATPLGSVKVFFSECFSIPFYYWFFFMISISEVSMICRSTFNILFAKETLKLSIEQYGEIMMYYMIVSLVLSIPIGFLIDKFNALKVYLAGSILIVIVNVLGFFMVRDYNSFLLISLLLAVVYAIHNVASLPLYVMILPKEKFGQYSAATALFRSCIMFIGGYCGGLYIQWMGDYKYIFMWDFILTAVAVPFLIGLIIAWEKRGGEENYVAPVLESCSYTKGAISESKETTKFSAT